MVKGISGSQGPSSSNPLNNGSITYSQAEQVEQNLQNFINGLPQNSGERIYASQLLLQIQSGLSAGPNNFDGAKMLQNIQLGLNYTNDKGQDIYLFSSFSGTTSPPLTQSQVEDMLNQIFSNVQPTPTFSVPAPTLADNTFNQVLSELPQISNSGADGQFKAALEDAIQNITSGMSASDLYNSLKGISTNGVDPQVTDWYNSLLGSLE
jgi:hypothetical protein